MHPKQSFSFISAILLGFSLLTGVNASEKTDKEAVFAIRRQYQMKHFDKANEMALGLLRKQEKELGKMNPVLVETLNLVVASACAGKKCSDTTPWLLRLLAIRKKSLGANHPHVAVSLAMLGENAELKGDLKKARDYYQSALDIRLKVEPNLVEPTQENLKRIELKMSQNKGAKTSQR